MSRLWFATMMVATVVSVVAFGIKVMVMVGAALLLIYYVGLAYFTRGLEVASEIPTITRAQAVENTMRVMGRRTIAWVSAAGALIALMGILVIVGGRGTAWVWIVVGYGLLISVLYARKWFQGPPRQPNE
jgi:hypothetical protein